MQGKQGKQAKEEQGRWGLASEVGADAEEDSTGREERWCGSRFARGDVCASLCLLFFRSV